MESRSEETSFYLKVLAKSSLIVFIGIFFSKLFSYAYKIIIARAFGPEVFGLFSLALIIVGIIATVASFGSAEGLLKFVSAFRGSRTLFKAKSILKSSLILTLVLSLLFSIVLWFGAKIIAIELLRQPLLEPYLKTISLSIPFIVLTSIFLSLIRSFENVKAYTFLSNILNNGLKVLILLTLLYFGLREQMVPFSYVLSFVFVCLAAYLYSQRYLKQIFVRKELGEKQKRILSKEFLSYSWPFIFTGLLGSLFYSTDSLILGYYNSSAAVGYYNAAISLVTLFFIAPDLFVQLFLPLISSKFAQNKREVIANLTRQLTKWISIINIPLLIVFILFPGVIINIFFDESFLAAEQALRILSIGALFSGFVSVLTGIISMGGKSKLVLRDFIVFAIVNALLNILLVPRYGLNGAAVATAFSWVLFMATLWIQVRKIHGFNAFRSSLFRIVLAVIIPLISIVVLREFLLPTVTNLVIMGSVFGITYMVSLILIKALDDEDKQVVRSALNTLKRR